MKNVFRKILAIVLISIVSLSCSKDDDNNSGGSGGSGVASGTFEGRLQVRSNGTNFELGYVENVIVTITSSGSNATIKITGANGFDREFTGIVQTGSTAQAYFINLDKQKKPAEKNVGGTIVLSGNSLAVSIDIASDVVTVFGTPSGASEDRVFDISGEIGMLGNLVRK
jgi:hypothetical protein